MRYTNFDVEFPKRCLRLLGNRLAANDEMACTKLLAIGGTLVSATADRQFAFDTPFHIAVNKPKSTKDDVGEFLKKDFQKELPALRVALRMRCADSPPDYWEWMPCSFNLPKQIAGDEGLFKRILSASLPLDQYQKNNCGNKFMILDALRTFRNALAHGNVWLVAGKDFVPEDPRQKVGGKIVGFALATTKPDITESELGSKQPEIKADTPIDVSGLLISPFDLRVLIEAWARLLYAHERSRVESARLIDDWQGQ